MTLPLKTGLVPGLLCLLSIGLTGEEMDGLGLSEEQQRRLKQGEVLFLDPEGRNMLKAVIRIDASPGFVWDIMLDHERVPEYVEQLRRIEVLERGEDWKVVEHRLKMHALVPTFTYVFREEYGENYELTFNRVRGAFKELTGYWKLIPGEAGEACLLVYSTYVDFGWFVPRSWIKKAIDKQVPLLLKTFREVVRSDVQKVSHGH